MSVAARSPSDAIRGMFADVRIEKDHGGSARSCSSKTTSTRSRKRYMRLESSATTRENRPVNKGHHPAFRQQKRRAWDREIKVRRRILM
jgi:hypothetical protein